MIRLSESVTVVFIILRVSSVTELRNLASKCRFGKG